MRLVSPVLRSMCVGFLVAALGGSAIAQSSNATLHGTIVDAGGGVLPGVTVKLQAPATGLTREIVSNAAGVYVFNFLPAGDYEITAELAGFKSLRQPDIKLEIGQSLALNLKMEVGQLEEMVTVEATAPLLDRTSASIGTVIQASQLKELPLAGRHWSGLMLLAPGAINTGDGTHLSTRFVGRARDDNNWTFDGIDATGVKDPRQDSDARLIISSESIAEFRVSATLYSAESGTAAGGVVQLISKAGTNRFHGTVFDFIRNDAFDARPFGTVGEMPPFNLNQFGINTGGPIVAQRTFFFANYEGIRQDQTRSFTRQVPSAAFRALAVESIAPVVALYPQGTNRTSNPDIDDWAGTEEVRNEEDAAMFRVDHRFSDKTTIFTRYNFDIADLVNPVDTGVTTNFLRPSNFIVQVQRIFASHIVSETKFGYNQSNRHTLDTGPSTGDVSVSGFTPLTGPQETTENGRTFSVLSDVGIVSGRHNIKFGGEARRILIDVGEGNTTGLTYSSRPNFLTNRLESFSIVDFPIVQGQRWWALGYVQDDIKWRSNLTINAGLRYEFYTVPVEKDGRDKVWRIACGGFCAPGTGWYDPDYNNFGPRVGFAWAPARFNDNTVIRAGFGVFFGPGQNDDVFAPIDNAGARTTLTRNEAPKLRISDRAVPPACRERRRCRARRRRAPRRPVCGTLQSDVPAGAAMADDDAGWLHRQPGAPHAGSRQREQHRSGDRAAAAPAVRPCRYQIERFQHEFQRPAVLAVPARSERSAARDAVHVVARVRRGLARRRRIDGADRTPRAAPASMPPPTRTSVTH